MCKILCVSKGAYSRLKLAVRGLGRKKRVPFSPKKIIRKRRVPVKARPRVPYKAKSEYEPTDIWRTRESTQWKWQRVNEWFREHRDLYNGTE